MNNRQKQSKPDIDLDRILFLGKENPGQRSHALFYDYNLSEFEYVVIDAHEIFFGIASKENGYIEDYQAFNTLSRIVRNKLDAIYQWVQEGGTLIIVLTHLDYLYSQAGGYRSYDLSDHEIFAGIDLEQQSGKLVEFCDKAIEGSELSSFLPSVAYLYKLDFDSNPLKPIICVSRRGRGPQEYVGAWRHVTAGKIIYAPAVVEARLNEYKIALLKASKLLYSQTSAHLPDWTERYTTPSEIIALKELASVNSQIENLQTGAFALQQTIKTERDLKRLFASTGDEFADAVEFAIKELGFQVSQGPHPRADLIATINGRVIAIEAKGLEGAGREANLRQADRWKAEVDAAMTSLDDERDRDPDLRRYGDVLRQLAIPLQQEALTAPCKGLMIVGTFRNKPVSERIEDDFPRPMHSAIALSKVCALSGLQLLGALIEIRSQPEKREKIVSSLLETNGVWPNNDWKKYFSESSD